MKRRVQRGHTLIEVLTASGMTILVIGGGIATMLAGMRSWAQGQSYIEAELNGQQAVKRICQELREAMQVTISDDGMRVSYILPRRDANGDFITPAESDNVQRVITVQANDRGKYDLFVGPTGSTRRISSNVILTDPEQANDPAYRPFTPGIGAVTRQVTVMLVTKTASLGHRPIAHRVRETIQLRNVPVTTR